MCGPGNARSGVQPMEAVLIKLMARCGSYKVGLLDLQIKIHLRGPPFKLKCLLKRPLVPCHCSCGPTSHDTAVA